ncbi:MAG: hypothetical protein KDE01_02200, partial [Caldilineaceae bacterium]|nr:hypothetical protein [Caldilineaceae bacterium]
YYEYLKLVQIDLGEFGGVNIQRIFPELATPLHDYIAYIQTLPGLKPMPTIVLMRLLDTIAAGYVVTARYSPEDARAAYSPEEWIDMMVDALLDGITEAPAESATDA